jgi:hypothetical protein
MKNPIHNTKDWFLHTTNFTHWDTLTLYPNMSNTRTACRQGKISVNICEAAYIIRELSEDKLIFISYRYITNNQKFYCHIENWIREVLIVY